MGGRFYSVGYRLLATTASVGGCAAAVLFCGLKSRLQLPSCCVRPSVAVQLQSSRIFWVAVLVLVSHHLTVAAIGELLALCQDGPFDNWEQDSAVIRSRGALLLEPCWGC